MNVLGLLFFVLSIFFLSADADAFHAEVLPYEVNQGDTFIIRVTGVEILHSPVASLSEKPFYFNNCGRGCFFAIGAVDVETSPGKHTIRLGIGEDKINLSFMVSPANFTTLRLTLPEDKVFLSPENLRRAEKEAERLDAVWQIASDKLWEGRFILPLENEMSTPFGAKRIINNKKVSVHKGMDIKGNAGDSVRASNRGRVVLTEELFFGGNTVILDHGQRIYTIYMHLSKFNVKVGDVVSKGDIIGFVGSSGRTNGPHLHFGVKVVDINTNPVSFVKLDLF